MFESGWSGAASVVEDDARARLLAHPESAWLPGELDPFPFPYDYPYVPVPAHLAHAHTDTECGSECGSGSGSDTGPGSGLELGPGPVVGVAGRLAAVVAPGAGLD
ncbi:MAG: hypothetical protein WAL50_05185, partial [Kineosporiaceae bacterium]